MLRQLRRKRLYGKDGTVVELSLDDVEVVSGGRVVERFAELEAEVREGDEAMLGPLAELLSEIEELVPSGSSKLDRAMEAVRRERAAEADGSATYDEAAAETVELDAPEGDAADDGDVAVAAEPSIEEELAVGLDAPDEEPVEDEDHAADDEADPFTPRPEDDLALQAALEGAAKATAAGARRRRAIGSPRPSRRRNRRPRRPRSPSRASRPARPRASSPTTTSPRQAARSSASTSPAWSPARRARARAGTTRSSTACGSPRAASGRRGACSGSRSTRSARAATSAGSRRSPATSGRCATSTSSSRRARTTRRSSPRRTGRRSSRCSPSGAPSVTPRGSC